MLEVFKSDAFSMVSLTQAIEKIPHRPTRIADLGLFRSSGITTTTAVIEEKSGQLTLIETSPRGAPGSSLGGTQRTGRSFLVPHLQRESRITADQVQGVRAFGSEDAVQAVQAIVNERLITLRAMHDVTLEYHRIGALKGIILDSDGATTVYNLFTEFGIAQQTAAIAFSNAATDVRARCIAIERLIETELGAEPVRQYRAFCGDTFFDTLIAHAKVRDAFQYQESAVLRSGLTTLRTGGFAFGDILWENYRGSVGGVGFVPATEAYVFPEGPDIYRTFNAPADFVETVNTVGLPIYAKIAADPQFNRYVDLHSQSNPLCLCTRPRAVVKVTMS